MADVAHGLEDQPAPTAPAPAHVQPAASVPPAARELDVLCSRQLLNKMKSLEDEADRRAPQTGKRMLAKLIQPGAVETKLTGRRPLQTTEQVQQRRLPTSARPHHRDRLAGDDVEIDILDRSHERSTGAVLLAQPARAQERLQHARSSSLLRTPKACASLEPAQISLKPQHHTLEKQPGDRAPRAQPTRPAEPAANDANTACRCASTSRTGSASRAAAAATSLR